MCTICTFLEDNEVPSIHKLLKGSVIQKPLITLITLWINFLPYLLLSLWGSCCALYQKKERKAQLRQDQDSSYIRAQGSMQRQKSQADSEQRTKNV